MNRFIIFFAIILIWIVLNFIKLRHFSKTVEKKPHPPTPDSDPDRKRLRCPGRKYSWAWMQAAGALGLKFIRPEESNGYPAIHGRVDRIKVNIRCLAGTATVFHFHFQDPAENGLILMLARNPEEVKQFAAGRKTQSLPEIPGNRTMPEYFFQTGNMEIFRRCFSEECLDHLTRLCLIYPSVLLTDRELQIRTSGISDDPQGFRMQLSTLLDIARSFADFIDRAAVMKQKTARCFPDRYEADRTSVFRNETLPESDDTESFEPTLEEIPSEAEVRETAPHTPEKNPPKPDLPMEPPEVSRHSSPEQPAFLRDLWGKRLTVPQQKKLFEPYQGMEVEWEGRLKMHYTFSTDFTFGRNGGVKATFELDEFKPEGGFLPVKIKAVAAFPGEAADQFAHAGGKNFHFRGKLLKIEPVAREIYLSDGRITGTES